MNSPTNSNMPPWEGLLDLNGRGPHEFFRSVAEIDSADPSPLQAHAMRRAWKEMELDGILCVDRIPVIYFKEISQPEQEELRRLQRQLWNQSIAPILLIITREEILVYSGLAPPAKENENVNDGNRLVGIFNRVADGLEIRQFLKKVELGEFFRTNPKSFDPDKKVDHYLLENLKAARDLLEKTESNSGKLNPQTVHALLGRTIFTCYLVDRGIINGSYFESAGALNAKRLLDVLAKVPADEGKDILFKLFERLKFDFNGDVFDGDLEAESLVLGQDHLDILSRFLNGDNVVKPQRSLGFWAYDFSFIPIETISGIYESFLYSEAPTKKRETGVYYTPRFLAELVLETAIDKNSSMLKKRCLDPACGSGIFLVGLFNRMAEEWRREHETATYEEHAEGLIDILKKNLFGVDRSLISCRVAAFSLYIALLDQLSESDIQKLQEKGSFLPRLVAPKGHLDDPFSGRNIFEADFFDEPIGLPSEGFDLIIGNPPWVRPREAKKTSSEIWCETQQLPIPQRQVAAGFVWKAPRHLRDRGIVCLLLPAPMLFSYGKGIDFQRRWLSRYQVEEVMNLSDMYFYLFPGADHPALVVKYKKDAPDENTHYIQYVTPKTEPETLRAEILVITAEDRKELRLRSLLNDLNEGKPGLVWKHSFWGTARDRKFLDRLKDYSTIKEWGSEDTDNWKVNEGFNEGGKGKPQDREILHEIPFLPSKAVTPYVILETLLEDPPTFSPRVMSSETIFKSPHVLFPHGVSRKGKRIKAGFSSFNCSFKHSVRGIHANQAQEDELRFLACALASSFALYFFFHTSFNWAIDRPYILGVEYESFPLPKPDTAEQVALIKEVAAIHRQLELLIRETPAKSKQLTEQYGADLDRMVLDYFDVDSWEEALIEDTVKVWIPSATPHRNERYIPALEPSGELERSTYMALLLEALNTWAKRSNKSIEGSTTISIDANLGVVSLRLVERGSSPTHPTSEKTSSHDLDEVLGRLRRLLPEQTQSMRMLRNLKVFDANKLDILKPLALRFWTRTSALNDADEIAAAILSASREKHYGAYQG